MSLVYVVIGLALLQYLFFGASVGWARGKYGVKAPATTGHEGFERHYRVQMNTLELLIVYVPATLLCAQYAGIRTAAILAAIYVVGRFVYFFAYVKDPAKRGLGFLMSYLPIAALLVLGVGGAAKAVLTGN